MFCVDVSTSFHFQGFLEISLEMHPYPSPYPSDLALESFKQPEWITLIILILNILHELDVVLHFYNF